MHPQLFLTKVARLLITLLMMQSLVACSWLFGDEGYFRNRTDDYLKAKEHEPIPQQELRTYNALAIPPIADNKLPETFEVPRPEPLVVSEQRNAVKIQKLGDQTWLLVPLPPDQAWPRAKYFFDSNRVKVVGQDAKQGLIETGWVKTEGSELKEKFRIRVEQGVQRNSSEIYVQQVQAPLQQRQPVSWPAQGSMSAERETWALEQLAQYLADISDRASVSLLAQGITNASRVTLEKTEDNKPWIDLDLEFNRAWASLGNALQKAEFTIEDINRSEGEILASREVKKAKKPFFLLRWFGASETETREYKIKVEERDRKVAISVVGDQSVQEQQEVLVYIKGFLN